MDFSKTDRAILAIALARFDVNFRETHPNAAARGGDLLNQILAEDTRSTDELVTVLDRLE